MPSEDDVVMDGQNDLGEVLPTTNEGLTIVKSIQGYVVMGVNIHDEATDEDVTDFFSEYGTVRSMHLNLDRQSGFVQGYVLVEYRELGEAEECIREANGAEFMDRIISVDYAFVQDVQDEDQKREYTQREGQTRTRDRSPSRYKLRSD